MKRISLSVTASCAIALAVLCAPPAEAAQFIRGDVNGDASVNIVDIQLLVNKILGIAVGSVDGDLNRDGNTNVQDLQLLVNVILGLAGCPG